MKYVAASCCASCIYEKVKGKCPFYGCIVVLCDSYSPCNPILITELPEVKQLLKAYKAIVAAYKWNETVPDWAIRIVDEEEVGGSER